MRLIMLDIVVNPFFNSHFWIVAKFGLGLFEYRGFGYIEGDNRYSESMEVRLSDGIIDTLLQGYRPHLLQDLLEFSDSESALPIPLVWFRSNT